MAGRDGREERSQGSPRPERSDTPLPAAPPVTAPKRQPLTPLSSEAPSAPGFPERSRWVRAESKAALEASARPRAFIPGGGGGGGSGPPTLAPPALPPPWLHLPRGVNPVCARLSLLRAPGRCSRYLLSATTPGGRGKPCGSPLLRLAPRGLPQAQPYLGHPAGSPPG